MPAPRRFDHDAARARYAAGERICDLAAEFGVTGPAVSRVVTPGAIDRGLESSRRWRTGVCEDCGGPAMRIVGSKRNLDGRVLCRTCRAKTRRERLRFNNAGELAAVRCSALDCANGERWQPPGNFAAGSRFKDVRPNGIRGRCRACVTRERQLYREKHKIPCVRCGEPCLPANERGGRRNPTGLCRRCCAKNLSARKPGAA